MLSFISNRWNSFFHDRTGIHGCRVAGYMRVCFALCFLIDRIILLINLDFFFSPKSGVIPYRVGSKNYELVEWNHVSVFQLFPESMEFVWIVSLIGILQGAIVLLGATRYPRFHMLGLYVNINSMMNHNTLMWDGEDNMFRLWVVFFLFFPLDHCTIYDGFGFGASSSSSSRSLSTTWPMWIFRIFQIEMVLIYMGASLGKVVMEHWQNGSAIYRLTYGNDDYPGIFNPDFMFDRYGPLQFLTYSALLLESTGYILVWIPALRKLSVMAMISLHIGIDLSMNMHMFEWLSCIGWCVFLIQPEHNSIDDERAVETKSSVDKKVQRKRKKNKVKKKPATRSGSFVKEALTDIFIATFILVIYMDTMPYDDVKRFVPQALKPAWQKLTDKKREFFREHIEKIISPIGLGQGGDWGMYSNVHAEVSDIHIDAYLANGTIVENIWRSPDWSNMSNWKRKFYSRHMNFYGEVTENKDELVYFVELMSKPFLEQENVVRGLKVIRDHRMHKEHTMESSGGFWSPVVRHPMNVRFEETILVLSVGDCQDALSADTCAQLIKEIGCTSLTEQCKKSCVEDCSGSNFRVELWLDPNDPIDDDGFGGGEEVGDDDGYDDDDGYGGDEEVGDDDGYGGDEEVGDHEEHEDGDEL